MPVRHPGLGRCDACANVGAYGVEVGTLLRRVQLLDRTSGDVRWVEPSDLGLGYRTSVLKHRDDALVLAVEMTVRPDGTSAPLGYRELASALGAQEGERRPTAEVRDVVLGLRRGKGNGARRRRPRHVERGVVLHEPGDPDVSLPTVLDAIRAKVGADVRIPQFPGPVGAEVTKLSAGGSSNAPGSQGLPRRGRAGPLSTKHTLALTNRGHARTGDLVETGPHGPGRRRARVRRPARTGTRDRRVHHLTRFRSCPDRGPIVSV